MATPSSTIAAPERAPARHEAPVGAAAAAVVEGPARGGAEHRRTPGGYFSPSVGAFWRRRAVVVAALLAAAFLLTGLVGRVGAGAGLEEEVAGEAVVEPGQTLWDVAAETAPAGVDVREHLRDLQELNGLEGGAVDAWTVVLVPAR